MRNPNGYGTVYKLQGRRRNPWTARITIGKKVSESGRIYPRYEFLGYYRTRAEAKSALAMYNSDNGPKGTGRRITLGQIYDQWSSKAFQNAKQNYINSNKAAWLVLSKLESIEIQKISIELLEETFLESGKNKPTLLKVKSLTRQLFNYAAKYEYISVDKARLIALIDLGGSNPDSRPHQRIPDELIKDLWSREPDLMLESVLFLCYTGLRLSEFLAMSPDDFNMKDHYFHVPDSKTVNGIRNVPIHDRIYPIVEKWLSSGADHVFPLPDLFDRSAPEMKYRRLFKAYLDNQYVPHDCRHTLVSRLKELDPPAAPGIIKAIVGHSGGDITEAVYTHYAENVKLDVINRIE